MSPQISVIGSGSCEQDSELAVLAEDIGRRVARQARCSSAEASVG